MCSILLLKFHQTSLHCYAPAPRGSWPTSLPSDSRSYARHCLATRHLFLEMVQQFEEVVLPLRKFSFNTLPGLEGQFQDHATLLFGTRWVALPAVTIDAKKLGKLGKGEDWGIGGENQYTSRTKNINIMMTQYRSEIFAVWQRPPPKDPSEEITSIRLCTTMRRYYISSVGFRGGARSPPCSTSYLIVLCQIPIKTHSKTYRFLQFLHICGTRNALR